MKNVIILMGLAGSGKSTQGQRLAKELGGTWLSAGQVLRDTHDPRVNGIQERGELVPDSLTIPLMAEAIRKAGDGEKWVILDGYPRTKKQAKWIAKNLAEKIDLVLRIQVPREELIQRMKIRGREDDLDMKAIEKRFKIVGSNMERVCRILAKKGVEFVDVDGVGTMDEVEERIQEAINIVQKGTYADESEA